MKVRPKLVMTFINSLNLNILTCPPGVSDNEKFFVGVVSDKQWSQFCNAFGISDLLENKKFQTNAERVLCRQAFLPRLRKIFLGQTLSQLVTICERIGVPFAPILRPDQLFDDPHVNHPGATVEITLSNDARAKVPALPVEYGGSRLGLHRGLPQIGEHNEDVANELGYSDEDLKRLRPFLGASETSQPE